MDVNSVNAAGAAKPAPTASMQTGMDYQAFLQLLVAEMANQDPLNPAKSSEYIAQFAAFANVEQAIQTNARLDSLMTVSALTQADSLIGRTATSGDGAVSGTVEALRVTGDGVIAILEGGQELALRSGMTIE